MLSSNLHLTERQNIHRSFQLVDNTPDERFDRLSDLTKSVFNVAIAAVTFVDEEVSTFKSVTGTELRSLPNNESLCAYAIASGKESYVIKNLAKEEKFQNLLLAQEPNNIRFYAGVPFQDIYGHKLGTLCILDTTPREFSSQELVDLKNLSYLVGEMLKATQTAMNDSLTTLLNRRGFLNLSNRELDLSARTKSPLSIVLIDLNAFKEVNDNYGHKTGDTLLKYFAQQLKLATRKSDLVARIGGDEFVVLLPNNNEKKLKFLSRLNKSLAKGISIDGNKFHVKYSAGTVLVTEFEKNLDLEELLVSADQAMYMEKKRLSS
jgi:diguanylate cyclase (GGDEF)-like protein